MSGLRRSRAWRWLAVLAAVAVLGLGVSALFFAHWSEVRTVGPEVASSALADAIEEAGGGPAYLVISDTGTVSVRRELEGSEPAPLSKLNLLTWQPKEGRLLRVGFPFWFVRAKMTDSLNLGTLTSVLVGDWKNLDLRVSEDDLALRGPGLILDHTSADGTRVLLWTE